MKKEDITGTIVYLLILGFGAVFIFTVLRDHSGASGLGDLYWLFNLGALVAGVVFNGILFELAHLLGALVGGYSIISLNVLGFCFSKDAGKWKFGFHGFNGLTGETKIVPKGKNSANKRIHMFLRWMCRQNSPVDIGLWPWYPAEKLLIPLDVHVMQEGVKLGLLSENAHADRKTALALTKQMEEVFPSDPARADFALFGLGVDE